MRAPLICCFIVATLNSCLCSCSNSAEADRFGTRLIDMPNGKALYAESAIEYQELLRGLMFRESMPADRGMLFIHNKTGLYPYYMFQVKIPLDIIWIDSSKRVVDLAVNVRPCAEAKASQCPTFGGKVAAQFVLEVNSGHAAKYGVEIGSKIDF